MARHTLAVVCAWCNRIVTPASVGAGVTHTMCASCFDWTLMHPSGQPRPGVGSDLDELREPVSYAGKAV